jgi:hypothetical protein
MITPSDERPPLVRRGFLQASTIVFVLLLPLAAHVAWDYVETRRLNDCLDAIVRRGEPVTAAATDAPSFGLSGQFADADRFYRAASVLAGSFRFGDTPQLTFRMTDAVRTGDVPPDLANALRARTEEFGEALSLADRAAALPFGGFGAGYTFNYLTAGLISLSRLCEMRATERALAGDGDAALASLYADVRLTRAIGRAPQLSGLKLTLERTHPSNAARARLAAALAEIDRDDFLKYDFVRLRAVRIDVVAIHRIPWLARPWTAHQLTHDLDLFATLISAAEQPAPRRVAAVLAVGEWPGIGFSSAQRRVFLEAYVKRLVASAERITCARRLVAGEMVNCQL